MNESTTRAQQTACPPRTWTWAALILATLGTAGSLALSLGLGLKACPLCFYQRTFLMATMSVLAVGLWKSRDRSTPIILMVLPLIWAGLGVAVFHEYLVWANVLECPTGLLGLGTAPAQSLGVFAVTAAVGTIGAWRESQGPTGRKSATLAGAVIFGGLMSWASIAAAPPLPPAPTEPYDPVAQPLEGCRPAYQSE